MRYALIIITAFSILLLSEPCTANLNLTDDDTVPELWHGYGQFSYDYLKVTQALDKQIEGLPYLTRQFYEHTVTCRCAFGFTYNSVIYLVMPVAFGGLAGYAKLSNNFWMKDPAIGLQWNFVNPSNGIRAGILVESQLLAGETSDQYYTEHRKFKGELIVGTGIGPGRLVGNLGYSFIEYQIKKPYSFLYVNEYHRDQINYSLCYDLKASNECRFPIGLMGETATDKVIHYFYVEKDSGFTILSVDPTVEYKPVEALSLAIGCKIPFSKQGMVDDYDFMPHFITCYRF